MTIDITSKKYHDLCVELDALGEKYGAAVLGQACGDFCVSIAVQHGVEELWLAAFKRDCAAWRAKRKI